MGLVNKPAPDSLNLDIDIEVMPQELLRPQPKTESAEMLVDLPPKELRGPRSGQSDPHDPLPKSGVYDVKPVAEVRESSQPEVAPVELTKPKDGSGKASAIKSAAGGGDDIGMAQTLPAMDLSEEDRAKLKGPGQSKAKEGAQKPDLVFEASESGEQIALQEGPSAQPSESFGAPSPGPGASATPLSELIADKTTSSWYTRTWVIVTMAVVAAAAIAGTVILLTRSG
jgi:hypothetical protein